MVILIDDETVVLNGTMMTLKEGVPQTEIMGFLNPIEAVDFAKENPVDIAFVEYDTPVTSFKLPALTLQPLVENSIKHGLSPVRGPLTINIKSRETERGIEVSVEDNGIGFDTAALPGDNGKGTKPQAPGPKRL